jgi:hypothetical protein
MVYCDTDTSSIVVRTSNAWSGQVGETVTLGLDTAHLHWFNPENGQSLEQELA